MRLEEICAKCIWCDQCGGDGDCDLTPIDVEATYEDEYYDDLKMREEMYRELIVEMNEGEFEFE